MAGWRPPAAPNGSGVGQGIAFVADARAGTYVAEVAQVAVDRANGQVRVEKVFVAHDCGLVINPDGLRNQIEGGIVQVTGWTSHEQLTFDNHTVTSVDGYTYPILRFPEVPQVEVALIDRPDRPASGAGEPASMAAGAARANAFYDATGVRKRATPLTPARVRAALA